MRGYFLLAATLSAVACAASSSDHHRTAPSAGSGGSGGLGGRANGSGGATSGEAGDTDPGGTAATAGHSMGGKHTVGGSGHSSSGAAGAEGGEGGEGGVPDSDAGAAGSPDGGGGNAGAGDGNGGSTATGGSGATGGNSGGIGGSSAGTGGSSAGTGGSSGGIGGSSAGTGGSGGGTCTVTSTATQSDVIPTVFNVSFTTTAVGVAGAHIDFGLDTNYGAVAPVDLSDAATPLLGLKASHTYHYRVVVSGGSGSCSSPDKTVTTGALRSDLPLPTVATNNAAALAGGFLVTGYYAGKQVAIILDADGDIVWWFDPKTLSSDFGAISRARMDHSGKHLWIAHDNVPSATAHLARVAMDGTGGVDLGGTFTGLNHDFALLPDDTLYFIAYGSTLCDDIKKYDGGAITTVMNMGSAFSSGGCHVDAIEYSPADDTLIVSDLVHHALVKIKRTGELVWVLGGGADSDFSGTGATFDNAHDLHVIDATHLLLFVNGSISIGSSALEIQLDTTNHTATQTWSYLASPAIYNQVLGGVQRLPNGNTLVIYSTQGVIREVDTNMNVLQSLAFGPAGALGYASWRPTLYGPPPT